MPLSMRNRLITEARGEQADADAGLTLLKRLPVWIGLRKLGTDEGTVRTLQAIVGSLFTGFAASILALLSLVMLWLGGAESASMTLVAQATAVGLAAELVMALLLPRMGMARLRAISPAQRLVIIAVLGLLASGAWGVAVGTALARAAEPMLLLALAMPIVLGLVASLAVPVVSLTRSLAAAGGLLWTLGPSRELALVVVIGVVLCLMATLNAAIRQHIESERTAIERTGRHAMDALDAYEALDKAWFWSTNARGRINFLTDAGAAQFGRTRDDLIDAHFATLLTEHDESSFDDQRADHNLEFQLGAGLPFSGAIVRAPGDKERWWSVSGEPELDSHGRCCGFNGHFGAVGQDERERAEESRLASFDVMTGLPNRASARRSLEELLQGDDKRTPHFALMLMDLDRYKNVNDTLGHPVGDELLRIVAHRLARAVGQLGLVARLGGDEFKILLPDMIDKGEIAALADTIIARLALPYDVDGHEIRIGATIGIAVAPIDGDGPDELIRNADLALYAAKAAGRGQHSFYHPDMHFSVNERRALDTDLRDVLNRQELAVFYQPIVDAQTEDIVGLEALTRWNHPTRGVIPPSQFIPIAEEIGMISAIGDWVIRTACHEAAAWPSHLRIAVNLSPLQFSAPGLMATLVSALADSQLDPNRLDLEVTEGVLLNDDPDIDHLLNKLLALGVRLNLDDFGTGYASLSYLQRVPFSKVKIDRSFVRGAAQANSRDHQIFRSMVNLARELGMETVAEGAETLDEIALIRSLGCDQIQGYIYGYPITSAEALQRSSSEQRHSEPGGRERGDREPRLGLLRTADMVTLDTTHRVKIRNIFANGAMVEAPGDIPIGLSVELRLDDGWTFVGDVRWRRGNRFGVQFGARIDLHQLLEGTPPTTEPAPSSADAQDAPDDAAIAVPAPLVVIRPQPPAADAPEPEPVTPAETDPPPAIADESPTRRRHPLRAANG